MKLHAQNQLSTSINFWDIKVLKASLVMPDHTHLNLHGQLTTLIRYETACKKIHFIPPIVFEIFKFKKPEIWLAKSILAFNSRTRFFPDMLWFKPIKFTYQQIFFLKFLRGKKKKKRFWGVLGNYLQNEIFFQKSGSVSFLSLMQPNFMRSFRKFLLAVWEKTRLLSETLAYRFTESG